MKADKRAIMDEQPVENINIINPTVENKPNIVFKAKRKNKFILWLIKIIKKLIK